MTDQERLIAFMWKKQKLLPVKKPAYFTDEDAKCLMEWPDGIAARVVKKMIRQIIRLDFRSVYMCPFCLRHFPTSYECNCNLCGYGKTHRLCSDAESDFQTLEEYVSFYDIVEANRTELLSILEAQ